MKSIIDKNAAADNTKVLVSAVGVHILKVHAANPHTAMTFLQLFNAASTASVTLGTTPATIIIGLPLSSSMTFDIGHMPERVYFDQGLVYAVTSTAAGSTAPGANAVLNILTAKV